MVLSVVFTVVWAVVENDGDDPLDDAIVIAAVNPVRLKSVPSEFLGEITNSYVSPEYRDMLNVAGNAIGLLYHLEKISNDYNS